METKTIIYEFNGNKIEFLLNGDKDVKINATQMAKVFGKDLFQYTKSQQTKYFLEACLKPANAGLLDVKKEEDLIISKQKSETFMHRIVALDFAAWLNPDFKVWIYLMIANM